MQNSLLPKEDAYPSSPFLNEKLEEILKKKIKVWILKRFHKQTSCCRSPTRSQVTEIATHLQALTTAPRKDYFYGNNFPTRELQLSEKHWNCRWQQNCLSLRAGSAGRAAVSQPAHLGNGIRVPALGRSLSFHRHKGGRVSMKSTLSTVHSTELSVKTALAWPSRGAAFWCSHCQKTTFSPHPCAIHRIFMFEVALVMQFKNLILTV